MLVNVLAVGALMLLLMPRQGSVRQGVVDFSGSPIPTEPQKSVERQTVAPRTVASPSVATLVGMNDCRWANDSLAATDSSARPSWRLGDAISEGQSLELKQGLLEIEFHDGARVLVEGPAVFRVQSRAAGELEVGQLTAKVPPRAVGFEIETPGALFRDLGTEFGVSVARTGGVAVHVFVGEVRAQFEQPNGTEVLLIKANESVRMEKTGGILQRLAADDTRFVRQLPVARQSTPPEAIALIDSRGFENVDLGTVSSDKSPLSTDVRGSCLYAAENPFEGHHALKFTVDACQLDISNGRYLEGQTWYYYDMYLRVPSASGLQTSPSFGGGDFVGGFFKHSLDGSSDSTALFQFVNVNDTVQLYFTCNPDGVHRQVGRMLPGKYHRVIFGINPDINLSDAETVVTAKVWIDKSIDQVADYTNTWSRGRGADRIGSLRMGYGAQQGEPLYIDNFVLRAVPQSASKGLNE